MTSPTRCFQLLRCFSENEWRVMEKIRDNECYFFNLSEKMSCKICQFNMFIEKFLAAAEEETV